MTVKFWHCEDDPVVNVDVTRAFISRIQTNRGRAELCTFPTGEHEPQLVGAPVSHPVGNTVLEGKTLEILPAVDGVLAWILEYDTTI